MKLILRTFLLNALILFVTASLLPGLKIAGGLQGALIGGIALSLLSFLVKPVLNILTLPFNLITFGAFSFVVNAIILYLLTVFVPQILVVPFVFPGVDIAGFIIPRISFAQVPAYLVVSLVISVMMSFILWLWR